MSWYFLGGFSAYFSVPSGRRLNHSGCSFSHGWSGEHWQPLPRAVEAAPRARKELVPGAEAREHPVDVAAVGRRPRLLVPVLLRRCERVLRGELRHAKELRPLGELAAQILLPRLDL